MDIETLEFRALCIQVARNFFINSGYLELDTPILADALIPETCLEVFRTEYIFPFKDAENRTSAKFLVPSPEVFIKPVIAQHKRHVFQLSKCFRNAESCGKIHNPEFTMLEYYTVNADYKDSIKITEDFLVEVAQAVKSSPLADSNMIKMFKDGIECLTMDDAFYNYAGFRLSKENSTEALSHHAEKLGLGKAGKYKTWKQDDLYELILVHSIEPNLPKNRLIALTDYPTFVPCLAKEKTVKNLSAEQSAMQRTKERWELYASGIELANCYTELRDKHEVDFYFNTENELKQKYAIVKHPAVKNFGNICASMPPCSGIAMGVDRLIMLLAGKSSLDSIIFH